MKSTVILCADDFGISAGVNRAILDLAAQGRLSAVSCMSGGQAWVEGAKDLKPLQDKVDVGLHITFTYLPPLTKEFGERHPSEKTVILKSWLRCLDKSLVEKEIRAQFEKFIKVWGSPPDFIDGHQHVHVLPVIREALLRLRNEYAPTAWMRNVFDLTALRDDKKHIILDILGWRWLELLNKNGIPHNKLLRGAYDLTQPTDYAALMARWCSLREPVLIYCHPGFPDAGLAQNDTMLEPRRREYDFFNGSQFRDWLAEGKVTLIRRPQDMGHSGLFHLSRQIKRFLATGSVNTAFSYLAYAGAILLLHVSDFWAVIESWCLGVVFSYFTFSTFVFSGGGRGWRSFKRFLPTYVALLCFNEAALKLLVSHFGWNDLLAQAPVMVLCAALSFILNRIFVFT